MISNIESGRFGISGERLRRPASIYECDDTELIDGMVEMTGGRTKGWWDEYRGKIPSDFLGVAELEHHATNLRTLQTAHILGSSRPRTVLGRSSTSSYQPCLAWRLSSGSPIAWPSTP